MPFRSRHDPQDRPKGGRSPIGKDVCYLCRRAIRWRPAAPDQEEAHSRRCGEDAARVHWSGCGTRRTHHHGRLALLRKFSGKHARGEGCQRQESTREPPLGPPLQRDNQGENRIAAPELFLKIVSLHH
jgi:hypothetical protein